MTAEDRLPPRVSRAYVVGARTQVYVCRHLAKTAPFFCIYLRMYVVAVRQLLCGYEGSGHAASVVCGRSYVKYLFGTVVVCNCDATACVVVLVALQPLAACASCALYIDHRMVSRLLCWRMLLRRAYIIPGIFRVLCMNMSDFFVGRRVP